jgi:hypothetical protein
MDCIDVKKWIDKMPSEKGIDREKEVESHLRNCPDCQKYFEEHERMALIISNLRDQNPVLKNPDKMKLAILSSIENEKGRTGVKIFPILFLTRFLAAATVALLITLSIEQYFVIQKVQYLEIRFGQIDQPSPIQEMRLYKSSIVDIDALLSNGEYKLTMKKLPLLLRLKRIENPKFTYEDLKRNIDKDENIKKLIDDKLKK